MAKIKKEDVKQWGFYSAYIPYWDSGERLFKHKARPVVVYKMIGDDVIVLPLTSNENEDGTEKTSKFRPWNVSVKLEKFSLIKCDHPTTLHKGVFFKYFGKQASTDTRRRVRESYRKWSVLKEK